MLIRNGHVVTGFHEFMGDVLIVDGRVAALGQELQGDPVIDATDCWVLPGAVDVHVHTRVGEHSMMDPLADDLPSATRSALLGGVTTISAYATRTPDRSLQDGVRDQIALGEAAGHVDFALNAFVLPDEDIEQIVEACAALGVRTFKAHMSHHKRGMMLEDDQLLRLMRAVARVGGTVLVHAENGRVTDSLAALERNSGTTPESYFRSVPGILESEGMYRAACLATLAACTVVFVHLSSRESVALAQWLRSTSGFRNIFWETQPHYLALTNDLVRRRGALAKVGPPLREREDVEAVWTAVRTGVVSHISSDHAVRTTAVKLAKPDILDAPYGLGNTATLLPLVFYFGVQTGRFGIADLVRLIATNPARRYGLFPRKGTLTPGADGDVVVLPKHGRAVRLTPENVPSSADYSLYEDVETKGFPRYVIRSGRLAVSEGRLADVPSARYLARGTTNES